MIKCVLHANACSGQIIFSKKEPKASSFRFWSLQRLAIILLFFRGVWGSESFADSGIFQTYVILDRGDGNRYLAGGINTDGANTFDGSYLGSFNMNESLVLNGAEVKTYKNSGSDVYGANINYRVYPIPSGPQSFASINLPFNCEYPDCLNNHGDQDWAVTNSNINLLDGLLPGNYYLEIYWDSPSSDGTNYDSNYGNNFKATFTVYCVSPWLSFSTTNTSCMGAQNGAIDLTPMDGTTPYSYQWSNGSTDENISGLSSGNYSVTVTTPGGCSASTDIFIWDGPPLSPPWIDGGNSSINCPNASITLAAGEGYASYQWSNGSTSESVNVSEGGPYNVTVTNNDGCSATSWTWVNTNYQVPTSINSTSDSVCIGETVSFNEWPQNDVTSWLWDFGDGSSSANSNVDHNYGAEGAYDVQLTMNTNTCGTVILNKSIVASNTAIPSSLFNMSAIPVCPGDPIQFYPQNYRAQSYYWDFGDGSSTYSQNNSQHSYSSEGDYLVTLTVTNSCGQIGKHSQVVTISDNLYFPSWLNIGTYPSSPVCINQPISLSVYYGASSYQWDFGDQTSSNESSPTHAYAAVGDYTVSLKLINGCGHDTTITTVVSVGNNVAYNGDVNIYVSPSTTACPDDKLYFNGPDAQSYLWDFGDGTTSTDQYPNHSYSELGNYTVSLTVSNYCGNTKTTTTQITIDNSSIPNINQNMYGTPSGGGCPGDSIIFYSMGASHYLWDFGDGSSTTQTYPINVGNGQIADITYHAYASPGTYTVNLTYYNGCNNSVTASFYVLVDDGEPLTGGMAPLNNPYTTCDDITFTAFGGNLKTWDFGDGTNPVTTNSVEITHNFSAAGTYPLTLTITNGCGESGTFNDYVTVVAPASPQSDAGGDASICRGTSYSPNASASNYSTINWTSSGDGAFDNTNVVGATYTFGPTDIASGSVTLTLTANSTNACVGSSSSSVLLTLYGQATISPTSTTVCQGSKITLTANGGIGINYQWIKGTKNILGATNQSYTTSKGGNYKVVETNPLNCNSTSSVSAVVFATKPQATITALGNLNICNSGSVVLQANAGIGLYYQWKKGSTNILGATNQSYVATKAATYKVVVSNSSGCTRSSAGVKVINSCKVNEDASGGDAPLFTLYPNPSDGNFVVNLDLKNDESGDAQLLLYNDLGQVVYCDKTGIQDGKLIKEIHLDRASLPGIYLLRVIIGDQFYTQQLAIQ